MKKLLGIVLSVLLFAGITSADPFSSDIPMTPPEKVECVEVTTPAQIIELENLKLVGMREHYVADPRLSEFGQLGPPMFAKIVLFQFTKPNPCINHIVMGFDLSSKLQVPVVFTVANNNIAKHYRIKPDGTYEFWHESPARDIPDMPSLSERTPKISKHKRGV